MNILSQKSTEYNLSVVESTLLSMQFCYIIDNDIAVLGDYQ